jgi:hypothetical protein
MAINDISFDARLQFKNDRMLRLFGQATPVGGLQ